MSDSPQQVRLFRGQDYAKLKAKYWADGKLFEDPEFPANNQSLGFDKEVVWKRPTELVNDPKFMLDANRFSVVQGELGDCWFMSGLSAITLNPGLLRRVIPKDQDFTRKYIGIFHFRFWQSGEWVDVVVDDQLPVVYETQLCFSHSRSENEFWSALLEKAYAKLHGSYGALEAGKCYEATEDLSGGVTERFLFRKEEPPRNLFSIILRATQRGSLITCNVPLSSSRGQSEKETDNGLVAGHGYCLTGAKRCKISLPWKPHVDIVRLRNPWGDETEWSGAWSDNSDEWRLVPEEEKNKLKLTTEADGEFWMTFNDFQKRFEEVSVTSLNPQSLNKEALKYINDLADVVNEVLKHPENMKSYPVLRKKVWEVATYNGSWVRNSTAGGAPDNVNLFSNNPQYVLNVTETDDDSFEPGTCTVVVSVTQKNCRIKNLPTHHMAIIIYKVNEKVKAPCPRSWFRLNAPMFMKKFVKTRTVTHRLHLKPGKYMIIPCTSKPDMEGEYLLRVFCEKAVSMEENDEDAMILNNTKEDEDNLEDGVDSHNTQIAQKDTVRNLFFSAADEDSKVNATKLQNILTEIFQEVEFSLDLSRSLLGLMDRDLSGNIDYYEFDNLVTSLRKWMNTYNIRKDKDTKLLCGRAWGLGDALKDLGYQVPRRLQALIVVRYGDEEGNISLRDFLMATSRISVMLERFEAQVDVNTKQASLSLCDWLRNTLYC